MQQQFIRRFVRDTLDCTCPDDVFAQLEVRSTVVVNDALTDLRTIVIGRRLSIYLWETDDPTRIQTLLQELVSAGRDQRDKQGLNRYRAVIATNDLESIGGLARRLFNHLEDRDEKVHLHVVDRQDAIDLLR